ncbi:hypothetical protein TCAL_09275 [Tigriopus californicus]|uniref:SEC7 domain-containing protein n=1 Tax=Tigriopus californicus TaxID=6832 RepID=A0A553PT01_TIGCA|nr:uncharacterized protein LOC131891469 [Tigriopus californicus]TRY80813.1 hypothetical protein TCAL_09275 [Tigriopus californicus]
MGSVETLTGSLTSSSSSHEHNNNYDEHTRFEFSFTMNDDNRKMMREISDIEVLREGDSFAKIHREELFEDTELVVPSSRRPHQKSLVELAGEVLAKTEPILAEAKGNLEDLSSRISSSYSSSSPVQDEFITSHTFSQPSTPTKSRSTLPPTSTLLGLSCEELPRLDSSLPSPGGKSVHSLSSLSPNRSFLQRAWLHTLSRTKKTKKRSLNAAFDALPPKAPIASTPNSRSKLRSQNRSELALLEPIPAPTSLPQKTPLIPRSNSAGESIPHRLDNTSQDFRDDDEHDIDVEDDYLNSSHQVSHVATSDLRKIELQDKLKSASEVGFSCALQEDESANEMEVKRIPEPIFHHPQNLPPTYATLRHAKNSTGGNPHSQGYFTLDPRRQGSKHYKKSMRDKSLLYGIKQYNLEPKRGIEYLLNAGFLPENDAKSVAQFLFREGRLSKRQIGKYIGGHEEFNREVLHQFVRCHEFTHLNPVQALRQFLWSFRLPGEAMQIDRLMVSFANRYCEQNPKLFQNVDTCYILSFSIIMLNTALHNPNVKPKITIEQFIKQNKGIDSGRDLAPDVLEQIYRSIKEEPFKIPNETYDDLMYTFFSPEREGWLMKQGGSWKNWKRRWFVLSDRCLYYFQHTAENVPKGIIPLENVKVRLMDNVDSKSFCFELYSECTSVVKGCKTDNKGNVVQGKHKSYRMSASSEEERSDWVKAIKGSAINNEFEFTIAGKKAALRRMKQNPLSLPNTPQKQTPAKLGQGRTPALKSSTPRKLHMDDSTTPIRESQAI